MANNNNIVVIKNHIIVLENLFLDAIDSIDYFSSFLKNNIRNNFNEYLKCSTDSKKNRIMDNIKSNIDKLVKSEDKKGLSKEVKTNIKKLLDRVNEFRNDKLIDGKYAKVLNEIINKELLSDVLYGLLNEYNNVSMILKKEKNRNINKSISKNEIETSRKKLENLVDQIKSKKNKIIENYNNEEIEIELPNLKPVEKKVTPLNVRSLIMLHDGHKYIYYNIEKIGTNKYRFDLDSFCAEEDLYNQSIIDNRNDLFSEMILDNDVVLAPFEKRRMQFIQNMFEMEKGINKLCNKKIDITTSLDKYYIYAKSIVDNYYLQIMSNDSDINALNTLMYFTRISYGAGRQFDNYNKVSTIFLDNYNKVPGYVSKELLINSYSLKSKIEFREFRQIPYVIPRGVDIINILNERLIGEISNNIINYIGDINYYIDKVSVYMNVDDLMNLYFSSRNSLNRNSLNNNKINDKDFIKLQRKICEVICRKLGTGIGNLSDYKKELFRICNEVLHENPLFIVDRYEVISEESKHKRKIEDECRKIAYSKYESDINEWNSNNSLDKFINKFDK